MPELMQVEKQEAGKTQETSQSRSKASQKEVLSVKEDSSSELDVRSEKLGEDIKVDLTERTITQRVEKFVEDGEEKKLIDIDEDEDSRSFTITSPRKRYEGVVHPLALVETPEHEEVDFSHGMHLWRIFNSAMQHEAEVGEVNISFPQVDRQQAQETVSEEMQLQEVEDILENDSVPRPERQLNVPETEDYDEYEETYSESRQYEAEEDSEFLEPEAVPASVEVEEDAAIVTFDVETGLSPGYEDAPEEYDLEAPDTESFSSPLLEYIEEEGLEEFSLLSGNLLHAEYTPEATEEGIHQRLVYQVEDELEGANVRQVAEYLSENAPVEVNVEAQTFYSEEEFEMGGELKQPGEYTVHGFDIGGMDESMTEFRVNNELAEDSIEHVEVSQGDYIDFVEADVYSGHA